MMAMRMRCIIPGLHVTEMQLEDLQPTAVEEMKDAVQVWQEIIQETEADR